ncbi:MAG: SDR family oxidoreductase [Deltaproteobacteria bacterium]|nr:SDR family oxidoreductase [Deltaproteobacteria bacterium]
MSKNRRFVLVTGGAGYIGSVLVPVLLGRGYKVRVFDKLVFGYDGLTGLAGHLEIVQGDVCAFDEGVLDDVDKVIHLAALSNDPTADFNPEANRLINVEGTRNVASACVRRGVDRFVYASSCSIYYSLNPYDGMLHEDSEISPTAPYSLSKKLAEGLLREMASPSFCPVALRKGTVFGASPRMRYDLVVNAFARDAWQKGRLTVNAGGEMWRPLLAIEDAAEAYVNALELPDDVVRGRAFNVLHKNYRVLELAHWTKHVLRDRKKIEVDVRYEDGVPPRSYQVSGARFREVFGYGPPRGISQALLKLWERFEQGVATDFGNPEYYNVEWFKLLSSMQGKLAKMGAVLPQAEIGTTCEGQRPGAGHVTRFHR